MTRSTLLHLAALVWFAALPVSSSAQSVQGHVVDASTGEALPGATVHVVGTTLGTSTNWSGLFELQLADLSTDRVTLSARFVGYESEEREIDVDSDLVLFALSPVATPLDELLVEQTSLTGGLEGIQGLAGSAHFVSARAIQKFNSGDIHQILRSVPGVVVQEEDAFGLRPNIGIRGTGSERSSKITLMEDGILMAPAPYTAPAAYYFPSVGRMEGVEVRKGSSQIRFGPNTTGGALNMLSTSIPSSRAGFVDLTTGSNEHLQANVWAGGTRGQLGFLVQGYLAHNGGFKELDGGGSTGFDKGDLLAKMQWSAREDARLPQRLLLKLSLSQEASNETYLGLSEADFAASPLRRYAGSAMDEMDANQRHAMLRHVMRPLPRLSVSTTAYATRVFRNWYKLDRIRTEDGKVGIAALLDDPDAFPDAFSAVAGSQADLSTWLDVKANNRVYHSRGVQTDIAWTGASVDLDAGVRLHYDDMDRFQWRDAWQMTEMGMELGEAGTPGTESNRIERSEALASYLQATVRAGRWTVTPGVRSEIIRQWRDDYGKQDPQRSGAALKTRENRSRVLLPGIGAAFALNPATTAFAGVHRGFSPPGTTEGTDPELSMNWEAGIRHARGVHHVEAVTFLSDYSNLLGSDLAAAGGGGTTDQFNGGEARAMGLELSGSSNAGALTGWAYSLPIRFSYTFTEASFQSEFESSFEPWGTVSVGDLLPYLPRHRVSGSFGLDSERWSLELNGAWTDLMRTRAGTEAPAANERVDSHFVLDVMAERVVRDRVRLYMSVRNLTDAVYVIARRPAGLRPGLPRTLTMGVRTRF